MVENNSEIQFSIDKDEVERQAKKAREAVLLFTTTTGATGAIPIPFADAPLLVAQQTVMLMKINSVFSIDLSEDSVKYLAISVLQMGGVSLLGKTIVSNLLKIIPVAGSIVGGAVSAGTAGALTLAIGMAYVEYCRSVALGKIKKEDMIEKEGIDIFKECFKEQMMKNRKK